MESFMIYTGLGNGEAKDRGSDSVTGTYIEQAMYLIEIIYSHAVAMRNVQCSCMRNALNEAHSRGA